MRTPFTCLLVLISGELLYLERHNGLLVDEGTHYFFINKSFMNKERFSSRNLTESFLQEKLSIARQRQIVSSGWQMRSVKVPAFLVRSFAKCQVRESCSSARLLKVEEEGAVHI